MFTAYNGQKFETLEKCEVHNKEIKEDMIARDEEKRLAELKRKEKLNEISELIDQINAKVDNYQREYNVYLKLSDGCLAVAKCLLRLQ